MGVLLMENQVQVFENEEFGRIGVLMVGDKPYFPATESARILGYRNPQKAIRDHCKGVNELFTPSAGGLQKTKFIPEGDLYRLIIRSKLPLVERFEKLVFDEVLPSIRKHGAYITDETLRQMREDKEFAEEMLEQLFKERVELKLQLRCIAPKAKYCDAILLAENAIPVTLIAKEYGMGAVTFNKLLSRLGIQFKVGKTWVLSQPYAESGYTVTRTYYINETVTSISTQWTQKGRHFLYEFLGECGIVPVCERRENVR